MKKFFSIFAVMLLAFTLVACTPDEDDKKITIVYNTNGGTTIDNQEVLLKDIASFTLPGAPTKEGFDFDGWYLDAEFVTNFEGLPSAEGTITLYAKWNEKEVVVTDKGIDVSYKLAFKLTQTTETVSSSQVELLLDAKVEKLNVEKFEDLLASVAVTINLVGEGNAGEPPFSSATATFGVENGVFYASLPMELVALFDSSTEVIPGVYLRYSVNLLTIVEQVTPYLEALLEEYGIELPGTSLENFDSEALLAQIQTLIAPYLTQLAELGLTEAFLGEVMTLFAVLAPTDSTVGDTTTYTITNAQFKLFLDAFAAFFEKNITTIYNLTELINGITGGNSERVHEADGYIFYYEQPYFTDTNGYTHSYSEDTDNKYGYLSSDGYYNAYHSKYVFDAQNGYEPIDAYVLTKYENYDNISILCYRDGTGIVVNRGEKQPYSALLNYYSSIENFAMEYNEGVYYLSNGIYLDKDCNLLTSEQVLASQLASAVKNCKESMAQAKEIVTLNKLEFSQTVANEEITEVKFTFDLSITPEANDVTNILITSEAKVNGYAPTVTVNKTEFNDMTATILEAILPSQGEALPTE